jgi:hypothetical protein
MIPSDIYQNQKYRVSILQMRPISRGAPFFFKSLVMGPWDEEPDVTPLREGRPVPLLKNGKMASRMKDTPIKKANKLNGRFHSLKSKS